jgi:L-lactate dehydrogenase (cytochrome)
VVSVKELGECNVRGKAWLSIKGEVYDLTQYLNQHPGGAKVLLACCGKEADEPYQLFHGHTSYLSRLKSYRVGRLQK